MDNLFKKLLAPSLPLRSRAPRTAGLTMVIDRKIGSMGLKDFCELNCDHFDFWKFGFGTATVVPAKVLETKVQILNSYAKKVFPGGTLFEYAYYWGEIRAYLDTCKKIGFSAIEISNGTVELPLEVRSDAIRYAKDLGFLVFSEVGSKDPTLQATASDLAENVMSDLKDGSDYIIIEGRESGKGVGIYDVNGLIRADYFAEFINLLPPKVINSVIWEAPQTDQQIFLIKKFGLEVNLGNINPDDVLGLEVLRLGLRWDTFEKKNT